MTLTHDLYPLPAITFHKLFLSSLYLGNQILDPDFGKIFVENHFPLKQDFGRNPSDKRGVSFNQSQQQQQSRR